MTIKESKYECGEISGTLWDTGSRTICLIVHGFLSNNRNRLFRNYAKRLADQGITSLRVNLYNEGKRNSMDVTLQDHIEDLQGVIDDLDSQYTSIIYIGHSLGGSLGGLINNNNVLKGMILRDSAIPSIVNFEKSFLSLTINDRKYVGIKRSRNGMIGEMYAEQLVSFNEEYFLNISCPYVAICCEKVGFYKHTKQFDSEELSRKTLTIPGSGHSFQQRGAEEKLFELSDEFIDSLIS